MVEKSVTVLGGGTFGTALADLLGRNGHHVKLWMRDSQQVSTLLSTRENTKYLKGYKLSQNIHPTASLKEAVYKSALLFISIPSKFFKSVIVEVGDSITGDQILVSTTKGFEADTFKSMSQIILEETCCLKVGVLSGPNLAKEIIEKKPAGTVIASEFDEVIEMTQQLLAGPTMRVYGNHDLFGVELGGALKNIYAICAGLITALDLGDNTKSLMMTRALSEMSRFARKLNANPLTFLGLAGVGDLIATCSSPKSRNFQVGWQLGSGKSLKEAVDSLGQVAEGVRTTQFVKVKADELGVYMPIVEAIYQVLYDNTPVTDAIHNLMSASHRADIDFLT